MSFFNKTGGFSDVIRCDEHDYLIWKWHPNGTELGTTKREFAIRTNSLLRVKDGEVAVFVYKQKDGTLQDYIVGPFDKKIKTGNFPILQSIIGMFYEGDSPFQAEIYFINLAEVIQVKFGVPYFNICDPRYIDFSVPVAVRGTITFKIEDYKRFIKCHRLDSFDLSTFQNQIRDAVIRYTKDVVTNISVKYNISVVQIESKIGHINSCVELNIKDRFAEDFGVTVTGVDIANVEIDKSSDDYYKLMSITKDIIMAKSKIDLYDYEEQLRIQREEGQYATHMETNTNNFNVYKTDRQTEVGVAGAEALGQMGSNGVGDINLGGNSGLNPMTMMSGIALGSAVGKNIADSMNQMMNGTPEMVPPVPQVMYHVAKDGKDIGSFNLQQLVDMISKGVVNPDTLVWKAGLASWIKANEAEEIKELFPPKINIE